ncbi:hypothetical protein TREPR_2059 [Treponema primitia ZAS-2]|uniref:Uncharacterized protein n=1 Tax=Treponema primitia (strain ATCC BAA-887 / DSM 12427 / ZAS-2) TaxID=545694 RepID=F5YJS8_TREPZ|nr:hypothetical protein TREPR_2059 [Treponema primitia ZAS-2]
MGQAVGTADAPLAKGRRRVLAHIGWPGWLWGSRGKAGPPGLAALLLGVKASGLNDGVPAFIPLG